MRQKLESISSFIFFIYISIWLVTIIFNLILHSPPPPHDPPLAPPLALPPQPRARLVAAPTCSPVRPAVLTAMTVLQRHTLNYRTDQDRWIAREREINCKVREMEMEFFCNFNQHGHVGAAGCGVTGFRPLVKGVGRLRT